MKKRTAIFFFIAAAFFSGCHKDVPVGWIERPDSLFYLKKSAELHEKGETAKAENYFFFTFLRFHSFKDEEIYNPEAVAEERFASLLEEFPKELREKYSLTPGFLKAIHAGKKIEREPEYKPERRETGPLEPSLTGNAIPLPPEPKTAPAPEMPASPEAVGPAPDSQEEKVFVRESQANHRPGRLQRLSAQRAKDKEILFKTSAPLSVKEVMEAFGLASRPENVSQAPEGFLVKLPFSAQHLGGMVGKKEQGPYVADHGGETLGLVIANVKELVPELCGKRAYRCSIFEKLYVKGKIADTYPEAGKKIFLWNKDVLKDYPFEELMAGKVKIKGGTRLQIFTDFYYDGLSSTNATSQKGWGG
ncbi:MAG: hypothetical protein HZA01_10905 [Nitrospinae bacterium]|nr:hypothetical protein [Nitrospinota bacterium]